MNRETVIETEEFKLSLEVGPEGEVILHMPYLSHWSVSVYKRLLEVAADVISWAEDNRVTTIYTGAPVEDKKTLKFQGMLGFEPWKIVELHGRLFQMMRFNV